MQEPEKSKSVSDHTVLFVDPQSSSKPKQPISEGQHHSSESESENEWIKEEYESEEEEYVTDQNKKKRKIRVGTIVKWAAFMVVMACLISSFTIPSLSHRILWGLELWQWFLTVLVIFCGRLVSSLLVRLAVFIIEHSFMVREKVLYYVHVLRRAVQICVWLALVLLAWTLIFDPKVQVPSSSQKLLSKVTRALIALLVGSIIWLVKIVLVQMLASWFHISNYFDRMKESVFHQYILETLSGEPLADLSRSPSQRNSMRQSKTLPNRLSMRKQGKGIDMEQMRKLSRGSPSTWDMKRLTSHVMSTGLSTISKGIDETVEEKEGKISSERGARREAKRIFKNVAKYGAEDSIRTHHTVDSRIRIHDQMASYLDGGVDKGMPTCPPSSF